MQFQIFFIKDVLKSKKCYLLGYRDIVISMVLMFFISKNVIQVWLKTIFTLDHFQATVNFSVHNFAETLSEVKSAGLENFALDLSEKVKTLEKAKDLEIAQL